ncbi:MAG: urease accessory protein UreF [Solirubrobacteraceae bacterium]|nr:urease accessory protein UreF [Solirubrobacteraceae bacterium]
MAASALELLLADGRTPTGGFAHSGGLEAAALSTAEVPHFLRARLRTVGVIDAAVAARAAAGDEPLELDDAWAARTPVPAVRDTGRRLGRALLRLASKLWPGALDSYAAASSLTPRPVVLGLAGATTGMDPLSVARLSLYDDAATVVSAAPKLLSVDALDATAWLVGVAPLIDALAARAAAVGPTDPLPAPSTPLLDRRAFQHHLEERRLFVS